MDASERFEIVRIDGVWGCRDKDSNLSVLAVDRQQAEYIRTACIGGDTGWKWRRIADSEQAEPSPKVQRFASGAVRGTDANGTRYDLISPVALEALAETYAEGAAKYGDSNWLKGIPTNDLLNHALRHLNLWQRGDTAESHLAHAAWNLLAMIHFERTRPDLVVRPYAEASEKSGAT